MTYRSTDLTPTQPPHNRWHGLVCWLRGHDWEVHRRNVFKHVGLCGNEWAEG